MTDDPNHRIIADASRVLPDGTLDDTVDMDADDYDAEREHMLWNWFGSKADRKSAGINTTT